MTPRYCIAIARKGSKTSALAVCNKLSELNAAIEKSEADEVDIYNKGAFVKTVRPGNIKAKSAALAERSKRLSAPSEPVKPTTKKAGKKKARPAETPDEPDEPEGEDPLG